MKLVIIFTAMFFWNLTIHADESITEPTSSSYWSCQCFESSNSGSPDMGVEVNAEDANDLLQAEQVSLKACTDSKYSTATISRCHKLVRGPAH